MNYKTIIMEHDSIERTLKRLSYEIIERHKGVDELVLIGIYTNGEWIAKFIKEQLDRLEGADVPIGFVDIGKYRDDERVVTGDRTHLPFDITNKKIILVDDVLYTGRTFRAAIELLFDLGRPKQIEAAVLVDRGHRELPIRADYVGKNIPTSQKEKVVVRLEGNTDEFCVYLV
ncbi:bifunctional pyr operon transcriptional regulator/uracil phosphoribosyltransferase PyrR [Guggenheimella bovis]